MKQVFKWVVYVLLIVNFGFYFVDDLTRALLTRNSDSTIYEWASEFATTIDESAWFMLIIMLELETYVLDDRHFSKRVSAVLHGVRLLCCVMIGYTIFTYGKYVIDIFPDVLVANAVDLCDLAQRSLVFTRNLEYTQVTEATCGALSNSSAFYALGNESLVTDSEGLALERRLAWVDLIEATSWIVIIGLIEVVIRLQERGIGRGRLISILNHTKTLCYCLILSLGVWWATLGHWLYLWDEILWVGGFAAIEMNLSEWRGEIEHDEKRGVEHA